MTEHARNIARIADVAFELELHEAIKRQRHRGEAFDVHAAFTHIARHHTGKPRRPMLIFPREARRQAYDAAFARALVIGGGESLARRRPMRHWLFDDARYQVHRRDGGGAGASSYNPTKFFASSNLERVQLSHAVQACIRRIHSGWILCSQYAVRARLEDPESCRSQAGAV